MLAKKNQSGTGTLSAGQRVRVAVFSTLLLASGAVLFFNENRNQTLHVTTGEELVVTTEELATASRNRLAIAWLALGIVGITGLYLILQARERRNADALDHLDSILDHLAQNDFRSHPITGEDADFQRIVTALEPLRRRYQRRCEEIQFKDGELEAVEETKNRFLANMSHEIRTPLTAILGFADMIEDDGLSEQRRRRALKTLKRNGRHLLHIVNDVLDLSKIEAGLMSVELIPTSPRELIRDVEDVMAPRAADLGLGFDVTVDDDVPQSTLTDPTRLRQILVNLTGNALKFTPQGEVRVRVSMATRVEDDDQLIIRVIDTGVGIPSEAIDRIFSPFVQADTSVTRRYGGTGLGLAISRQLAELLHGSLRCTSEVGKGSVFELTIRVAEHETHIGTEHLLGEDDTTAENPASPRVLVVEDSRDNQILMTLLMKKFGVHIALADNGQIGLDEIKAAKESGHPFAIIFMDMQMPVLDGYQAVQQLRASGCETPVIALTAHSMKGDRERCLSVGCTEFVTKPINRDKIAEILARYASKERSTDAPSSR